jgi:hypothetical protein
MALRDFTYGIGAVHKGTVVLPASSRAGMEPQERSVAMPDLIRRLADLSIARGCGFAALAVACIMISLAGNIGSVFRAGGIGCLLTAMALILKAHYASPETFKQTEVWIMLDKRERPAEDLAAQWITEARRLALLTWANRMAWASAVMLAAAALVTMGR